MGDINSQVFNWTGPAGLPEFADIGDDDLEAAFEEALTRHNAEIERIADDPAPADYKNTIVALETSGDELSRVSALFWNRAGAHSNETIQSLEREIAPKLARHYSSIAMNGALFARIDRLWESRAELGLDAEAARTQMLAPDVVAILNQDRADVETVGIRQTPTFFVNGMPLDPFGEAELRRLVAAEVAAAQS